MVLSIAVARYLTVSPGDYRYQATFRNSSNLHPAIQQGQIPDRSLLDNENSP